MSQPRHRYHMVVGGNNAGPFGDTTYTKIFVGGLAWETQRDTMRRYFEQFGEILEAVVITDKNTGRSKGYGFVTFNDPDAAMRACQDPTPVIDGRRANCNLASLGAQQRPAQPATTPHYAVARFRPVTPPLMAPPAAYQGSSSTYFHQPAHYAYPYSAYGYSGYPQDNMYPMNYYNVYGGQQQYPPYYTAASASTPPGVYSNLYPFYAQSSQTQGYGIQYPQMVQYPYVPQQYSGTGILSVPTSAASAASNTTGATASPVVITGTVSTSTSSQTATAAAKEHSSSPS